MRLFHIYPFLSVSLAGLQSLAAWSPSPLHDPPQATLLLQESASGSLPVPNSTHSFWMHGAPGANPLARVGSTGPLTADADICIIGSGITGVSVAYHLSKLLGDDARLQRALNIVILEARDFCSGATGRNGGHLTARNFNGFGGHATTWGISDAVRAVHIEEHVVDVITSLVKEAGLKDEVDLVEDVRTILFSTKEEEVGTRDEYEAAKAAGINVSVAEWLTEGEIEKMYGTRYPAVRVPGNTIWPLKLVTHLFRRAQNASPAVSLKLHSYTPVTAVRPLPTEGGTHRWQLETPRGPMTCTHVVHATNAYASALLPQLSGRTGIVPTRGQAISVRAAVPAHELTLSGFTTNYGGEYWFVRPGTAADERPLVILGGARLTEGSSRSATMDDSVLDGVVGRRLREFLPELFPEKFEKGTEPEMEWTGIMGFTELGDPFVGPVLDKFELGGVPIEGQYIAAGYSGHGMPRAFGCADIVARMIASKITGRSWEIPYWLPLHYLTTLDDSQQASYIVDQSVPTTAKHHIRNGLHVVVPH